MSEHIPRVNHPEAIAEYTQREKELLASAVLLIAGMITTHEIRVHKLDEKETIIKNHGISDSAVENVFNGENSKDLRDAVACCLEDITNNQNKRSELIKKLMHEE